MVEILDDPEPREDAVVMDTFGFHVPCRSFYVKVNVTRDRRLPVVDEHVLRLVRTCVRISVARLRDFFGMSRAEAEIVVADLEAKGLLVLEADDVTLSASAISMFRSHPDEEPRLISMDPWIEHVWIDLISRSFVAPPRHRNARNLLEVSAPPGSLDLPEAFARSAFADNFYDYIRRVKRVRDPDRVSIHSIAEVEADRFGLVLVEGRKVLKRGALVPQFEIEAVDPVMHGPGAAASRISVLVHTLADEYGSLYNPRPSTTAMEVFERLTGHSLRKLVVPATGLLDVALLRREVSSKGWLWGASYLSRNVDALRRASHAAGSVADASLVWLRPGGSSWGLTGDLTDALAALKTVTAGERRTTLIAPRTVREDSRKRFGGLFDGGLEAPQRLGGNLEIVVVDAAAAMIVAHLAIDARETLPVGVVVRDRTNVQRIAKSLISETRLW